MKACRNIHIKWPSYTSVGQWNWQVSIIPYFPHRNFSKHRELYVITNIITLTLYKEWNRVSVDKDLIRTTDLSISVVCRYVECQKYQDLWECMGKIEQISPRAHKETMVNKLIIMFTSNPQRDKQRQNLYIALFHLIVSRPVLG